MSFKIKQPMVLVTGIQVSPLPGECPDPRAAESCSLLPSGASGFDFIYLFFFLLSSFSRKGCVSPSPALLSGRGTAHSRQDLEDFYLQHQREPG